MRKFISLNSTERIKAVLAATEIPVDKSVTLELAGVNLFELDDQQTAEIEWVFSGSRIRGEKPLYKMAAEQGKETIRELDISVGIVNKRIIDVLWPRLCNEISDFTFRSGERKG